jgi:gamma-glutamyltranspeptidase/glutathione hydrolase
VHGRVVLGAPPPQTGAQVIHTLKLLEPHDLPASGLPTRSARAFDLLVSVLRVGMADNLGNDDPDWRSVPAAGRVSDAFARSRAPLVGTGRAAARIEAATAAAFDTLPPAPACARLEPWGPARGAGGGTGGRDAADAAAGETTHISVVDDTGNAVALTQTNSSRFGTGALVDGFFLNDSGYRFADDDVVPPGPRTWRTRVSTIAPTIVLEGGRVRLVIGAPGAARIPTEVAQNMIYILEHGLDPMQAARMPRVFPSPSSVDVQLEHGFSATVLEEVRAMGYRPTAMSSGYARIYMVVRDGNRWIGVADPRHDGEVRGH